MDRPKYLVSSPIQFGTLASLFLVFSSCTGNYSTYLPGLGRSHDACTPHLVESPQRTRVPASVESKDSVEIREVQGVSEAEAAAVAKAAVEATLTLETKKVE